MKTRIILTALAALTAYGAWSPEQAHARKKGVLELSQIPSSITAHAACYIDKKHEVIVGLQTDSPLKRAIMPNGGMKMVTNGLEAFGFKPDPKVV